HSNYILFAVIDSWSVDASFGGPDFCEPEYRASSFCFCGLRLDADTVRWSNISFEILGAKSTAAVAVERQVLQICRNSGVHRPAQPVGRRYLCDTPAWRL